MRKAGTSRMKDIAGTAKRGFRVTATSGPKMPPRGPNSPPPSPRFIVDRGLGRRTLLNLSLFLPTTTIQEFCCEEGGEDRNHCGNCAQCLIDALGRQDKENRTAQPKQEQERANADRSHCFLAFGPSYQDGPPRIRCGQSRIDAHRRESSEASCPTVNRARAEAHAHAALCAVVARGDRLPS